MKIGTPLNLSVGFIGVKVRVYAEIGTQQECVSIFDDMGNPTGQICTCLPEPCSLGLYMDVQAVLPFSNAISFYDSNGNQTQPPAFLSPGTPSCGPSYNTDLCSETIDVVGLPEDTQICSGLTMSASFLGGGYDALSYYSCQTATPGLNATLTANPNTIDQGASTTLSWQVSTSKVQVIHVDHVHIEDTVLDPPFDCGDQPSDLPCPPGNAVTQTPSGTTDYAASFTGTTGGVQDFFPSSSSAAQQPAATAHVTVDLPSLKITSPADSTVFYIDPNAKMPTINAQAQLLHGQSPSFNWTLEADYNYGNRNDKPTVSQTTSTPSWTPDFNPSGIGSNNMGDDTTISVFTPINGYQLSDTLFVRILGQNPTPADVKAYLSIVNEPAFVSNFNQSVGWQESHFTQFCPSIGFLRPEDCQTQDELGLVLRAPDNGFGIMQLTALPVTVDQLWSWKSNCDEGALRLYNFYLSAKGFPGRLRLNAIVVNGLPIGPFPDATDFSVAQLQMETWQEYNTGHYYTWDENHKEWIPDPNRTFLSPNQSYADQVKIISDNPPF